MKRLIATVLCIASFAAMAETITPTDWSKTFKIRFLGYSGTEELSDFPALVRLSPTAVSGFSYDDFAATDEESNKTYADLRFTDSDGTILDYEVDTWNVGGESLVWVRVPSLTAATEISCYYGNANATAQGNGDNVWKGAYSGVWHFNSDLADATGRGNTAEAYGVTQVDSVIGKAYNSSAEGKSNRVRLPDPDTAIKSFEGGSASVFTISGWFKLNSTTYSAGRRLFSRKSNYKNTYGWECYLNTANGSDIFFRGADYGDAVQIAGLPCLSGDWFLVTIVFNGKSVTVYGNGALLGSGQTSSAPSASANALVVGNYNNSKATTSMNGGYDEVRIRPDNITADRAKADYDTVATDGFANCTAVRSTTDVVDPEVVTVAATDVTGSGFTANGRVTEMGGAESLAVMLDYGTDADSLTTVTLDDATAKGGVSYAVTGLTPETTYVYRFRVQRGDEEPVVGELTEVTTLPGVAVLGDPSFVPGVDSITASVGLTRLAASDNGTVVKLYVSTDADNLGESVYTFDALTALPEDALSYTVEPLALGTTYYCVFEATGSYNGTEYTVRSDVVAVTTGGTPAIAWVQGQAFDANVILKTRPEFTAGPVKVSLWTGATADDLARVQSWDDVTSGEVIVSDPVDYPNGQGYLYYKFTAECVYTPSGSAEPVTLAAETEVRPAGKVTWTGAAGTTNWRDVGNWDLGVMPLNRELFAAVDGGAETNGYARIGFWGDTQNNITNAAIIVSAGDTNVIDHQAWKGNVEWRVDRVRNAGYLLLKGGAGSTGNSMVMYDYDTGCVFNESGAHLHIQGPSTNSRGHKTVLRINADTENDGLVTIENVGNNEAFARLQVVSSGGAITNNGEIVMTSGGANDNSGYANLMFGDGSVKNQTYTLTGTGRILMNVSNRTVSVSSSARNEQACKIEDLTNRHILVNDVNHTIEGAGYIKDLGINNYGMIRAIDPREDPVDDPDTDADESLAGVDWRIPLQIRNYYTSEANECGSRINNFASGKMIAMEKSCLQLGNAEHRSTFFNHGLLEARTGGKVEIRAKVTESVVKESGDTTDEVRLGGVIAGNGTIVTHRPTILKSAYTLSSSGDYPAAIVRPGDLALNDDREDDGLGASLVGTLAFTTNVTFQSGTTLEIQGERSNGAKRVDGITVDGAVTIDEGAKLKIMSAVPGGTYHLITATQPIAGNFTVEQADGSTKVQLSNSSVTVGEGDEAVTTYYLDGTFASGMHVIVR